MLAVSLHTSFSSYTSVLLKLSAMSGLSASPQVLLWSVLFRAVLFLKGIKVIDGDSEPATINATAGMGFCTSLWSIAQKEQYSAWTRSYLSKMSHNLSWSRIHLLFHDPHVKQLCKSPCRSPLPHITSSLYPLWLNHTFKSGHKTQPQKKERAWH